MTQDTTRPLLPTFNNSSISIKFLGINYDSNFGLDAEEQDIKQSGFKFSRSVLTTSNFEDILIESPPIIHISTHATHQYQKINKPDEFQIAFEEKQILRYLMDDHTKYSAIYTAIAILFEIEINHFVQYGFKYRNKNNNKGLKICIAKDAKRFPLLCNKNIFGILQCILNRYGCYYRDNNIIACIEIFWGKYKYEENNLIFIQPYFPINEYQLKELYIANDRNVKQIYDEIINNYQKIQNIQKSKHYKYNWWTLSNSILTKLHSYTNEEIKSDENNNFRLTKIKYRNILDLTRELKIIPLKVNKSDLETSVEKLKILISKVCNFKNKLVTKLKKLPLIANGIRLDFSSSTAKNVHIIRFGNINALTEAKKEINKIKEQIDVHHDYDIQFRIISKADSDTKKQVGFMEYMQEKIYSIDIKNKKDEISQMIKKHLKSKRECKIKLVILNGCHSYILGKIFSKYVSNVICIHPFVKIWATTATTFAKRFYLYLKKYNSIGIDFKYAVLKAFNDTKKRIAKDNIVSNDCRCVSHSHIHPFCFKLHLNENWKQLQNYINDTGKFIKYRNDMNDANVLNNEPIYMRDLYKYNNSLMITNVSIEKMKYLSEYLEREYKNNINGKFIIDCVYKENEYYNDLSVAFFKFENENLRDIAMKLLEKKQYTETLILSQFKPMKINHNFGWNYHIIPRCCCSPHHPHTVQDKFILLQNDKIINRDVIINDIESIIKGKEEIKQSKLKNNTQQIYQNDAYFGKSKRKLKKNNFGENDNV